MSGICAVWRKRHAERTRSTLASLTEGLSLSAAERIEDALAPGTGVAVCARFPTQQIYQNVDVLLVCDADLYNEEELVRAAGTVQLKESNKTAALLAGLYQRYGTDFAEKLRGAFSVALWDQRARRMIAAVDGFGINRLVYYHDEQVLLVASRINALLQSGDVDRAINPPAIANVLNFSANLGPETIFTQVQRVPPGTLLVASDADVRVVRYWDMRYGAGKDGNEARLSRELSAVVEESVKAHCKRDPGAELGAFLSGGTDSSTVTGMMARTRQGRVNTFSIGFEEQPFNELGYAEIAAKEFHTEHHTQLIGPDDCYEALPQMIRFFDEPFGNSSAIATYFCARLAAQHGVKTLLAGDGGDELFGGNERYATDKIFEIYHHVPGVLRKALIEPILARLPMENGLVGRARGYIRRSNLPGIERLLSFQFLQTHAATEVFSGDFLAALGNYSILDIPAHHYAQAAARDHLDRLLYVDMKITLADNDLPKVTCMSELAGIQTRFPFLDRTVAEFSGRIPARLKVKGFDKRYLFKRAFKDLLPAEIIRKKKHGFGIPVAMWIKSHQRMRELTRDTLLSRRAAERGYFRPQFIEELFRKHESEESPYYGDALWTVLAIELWHRQVVDEPARVAV